MRHAVKRPAGTVTSSGARTCHVTRSPPAVERPATFFGRRLTRQFVSPEPHSPARSGTA